MPLFDTMYNEICDRLESMNSLIRVPRNAFIAFLGRYVIEFDDVRELKDTLCV